MPEIVVWVTLIVGLAVAALVVYTVNHRNHPDDA